MFKTILVPVSGTDSDAATFAAAATVGRSFAAHLIFLHVGYDIIALAASIGGAGFGLPADGEVIAGYQRDAADRAKAAQANVDRFCREHGIDLTGAPAALPVMSAEYRYETGSEADIVAEHGRSADLILMPRDRDGTAANPLLEAVLFESGRPLLVLGADALPAAFRNVVIAWKSTREAAHAVAAAMPFIERAERVTILGVEEEHPFETDDGPRLMSALLWHRPNVTARFLPGDADGVAAALRAGAREAGADLVVTGGYGHSRLREFVFGGVTDSLLTESALPILMAH